MIPTSDVRLHDFTVVSNEPVAQGVFRLVMSSSELARTIEPGQFMNLAVPGDASHLLRIPLSFAGADAEAGTIELVYAVVGEGTERLARMVPGSTSTVVGPCGHGWRVPAQEGRCLLVAGGVGAPPVVAATRMLAQAGFACDVVIGARTSALLWGEDAALAAGACEVHIATDDGSAGTHGFTTDVMRRLVAERAYAFVLTCGPTPMMAGVAGIAAEAGIACQASLERMMTCGFGACSTCNVALVAGGYASCCKDGPVFDAAEVAW